MATGSPLLSHIYSYLSTKIPDKKSISIDSTLVCTTIHRLVTYFTETGSHDTSNSYLFTIIFQSLSTKYLYFIGFLISLCVFSLAPGNLVQ